MRRVEIPNINKIYNSWKTVPVGFPFFPCCAIWSKFWLNTFDLDSKTRPWYVLHVVSVTKQFLSLLVSIIAKFITARCYPKFSFSAMTVPRKLGGLGLLDPFIQQSALQLRWILPLLQHSHLASEFWRSDELTSSIVLPLLTDYLIHLIEISMRTPVPVPLGSDFRLPFLFPSLRPLLSKDREHPLGDIL